MANAIGKTLRMTQGASGNNTSCDFDSIAHAERVTNTFDNLGDLQTTHYSDSSLELSYTL